MMTIKLTINNLTKISNRLTNAQNLSQTNAREKTHYTT